ncbi:TPA: peptide MFS transporter [Legionella pneumophila]
MSWKSKSIGIHLLHIINGLITFSFAVLLSSLVLYLTHALGFSKTEANAYIGVFLAFNFALHLVAGYVGGRYISHRLLLLVSCVFQALGSYVLSWSSPEYIVYGLSVFIIGCGINSTSLKCILTQMLEHDESQREMAFFINYAAVNAGFLLGFFAGGYYDLNASYQHLFDLCNIFNVASILFIALGWRFYKEPQDMKVKSPGMRLFVTTAVMSILTAGSVIGFQYPYLSNGLVVSLGGVGLFYLMYQAKNASIIAEKSNITAFIILTLSSIVFWALFFVGPMGVTYFLKYNVQPDVWGLVIPPQWYMNLNSGFVILGAPLLGILLKRLKGWGYDFSLTQKFSLALLLIAGSFFALSLGVLSANELGYTSIFWIVLHFFLQAFGELLIAPVGLSMIGKLAPQRLQGVMMGFWMMVSGIAASLSQFLSNAIDYGVSTEPATSNPGYLSFFDGLGFYTLLAAVALLAFSRKIEGLISRDTIPLQYSQG